MCKCYLQQNIAKNLITPVKTAGDILNATNLMFNFLNINIFLMQLIYQTQCVQKWIMNRSLLKKL